MFKLNENYKFDRRKVKCDYIRDSPAETFTKNTLNIQKYINIPIEYSVISLLKSYLDIKIEVIKKACKSRHANDNDTKLVDPGPIALFSNFNLNSSSGKHLEDMSQALLVSLM